MVQFWGRQPTLCILLSMTEWSGSKFTYRSNAASNQATKPKLHGVHIIQQHQHQHYTDDECNLPLHSFKMLAIQYCSGGASNHTTKPMLHGVHSIPQTKTNIPLMWIVTPSHSFKMLAVLQNWCNFEEDDPPYASYYWWLSVHGLSSCTVVTLCCTINILVTLFLSSSRRFWMLGERKNAYLLTDWGASFKKRTSGKMKN